MYPGQGSFHEKPGSFVDPSKVEADQDYRSNASNEKEVEIPSMVQEVSQRRDPEEEFFMLAVLAHKMIHTEEFEAEYIYSVNAQKLY